MQNAELAELRGQIYQTSSPEDWFALMQDSEGLALDYVLEHSPYTRPSVPAKELQQEEEIT